MAAASDAVPNNLLKQVSRSFYLTLRVLPGAIRPQIGLAYLLARTTDTVADTEVLPAGHRLAALEKLRARILGSSEAALDFGEFSRSQGSPAERVLLDQCEANIEKLKSLSGDDCQRVREVLGTIIGGQEQDVRRFARNPAGTVVALQTDNELEAYAYSVAGCVGEFWTKICRAHLFPNAPVSDVMLMDHGARFGKGLQLVNILRDLPADLRLGRCYLPADGLADCGLKPDQLLEPAYEPRLRPLYNRWLDRAADYLTAGWDYTNALPRNCRRVRLACAWPILIGIETIKLLRANRVLDPAKRFKVGRPKVRRLMLRSILVYPWPKAWEKLGPTQSFSKNQLLETRV
jgi:farnesyl-diphosphate farnesyltransferase